CLSKPAREKVICRILTPNQPFILQPILAQIESVSDLLQRFLKAFPGEGFEGLVAFIYPELNMATRTAQARIVVANKERRIRIGQYADIVIESPAAAGPVIAVPDSAVIDSGTRRVALVAKGDGVFEPRGLVLGGRGDGHVEVKQGLSEGERIVVRGNFLIDAECNLRAALAAFAAAEANP
ncbi:MAG: efflux transporter periplasmic adaptor subunit, partial [Acidimicrobiia bacterium]|nr:efflux transporter periplasmic adaptor subunit [Acidimicrobiia bacterium]